MIGEVTDIVLFQKCMTIAYKVCGGN